MNDKLWQLPVSPTSIIQGPLFKVLPRRQCEISFSIEAYDGAETWISLLFDGVEAFKATYLSSLGSIDCEVRSQAYGTLISIASSVWLNDVNKSYLDYTTLARSPVKVLTHLVIYFDDGPCYEFICASFRAI